MLEAVGDVDAAAASGRGDADLTDAHPIRVLLVVHHPLLGRGIADALAQELWLEIVAEVDRLREAVVLAQRLSPDVMLLDSSACEEEAWVQMRAICSRRPDTATILLTTPEHDDVDPRLSGLVAATILRSVEPSALGAALRGIVSGTGSDIVVPDGAPAGKPPQLTPREYEVLTAISRGLTNRAIARELWLSEHTIKFHISSLYRKLGVKSRAEAATWLFERGIDPARVTVHRHEPARSDERSSDDVGSVPFPFRRFLDPGPRDLAVEPVASA